MAKYLYSEKENAQLEFARAFVLGNGLHSREHVQHLVEHMEKTAELMAHFASFIGDRHQAATPPSKWEELICVCAKEFYQ